MSMDMDCVRSMEAEPTSRRADNVKGEHRQRQRISAETANRRTVAVIRQTVRRVINSTVSGMTRSLEEARYARLAL